MQRLFIRIALGIVSVFVVGFIYITLFPQNAMPDYSQDDGRISVVATMYPLAYFAMGLDPFADITVIVGSGMEPHDYEPSIQDVKVIQDAEILLANGVIDEWALRALDADGRVHDTIVALEYLELSKTDPHFWLDPSYAETLVRHIGDQLIRIDPTRADVIRANVEEKVSALRDVDDAYRAGLQHCTIPEVVTAHEAFGFLARAYNFTAHGISGLNPEEEPSAAAIAEIVDLVRVRGITTVYFETLTNDALAETIALETGAKSDVLDPIESLTPGYDAATGYTVLMLENLEKLSGAMLCQQ